MPKAKERQQDDKIKSQGKRKEGKPVQEQARRVMTAKMRKELARQKRTASGSDGEPVCDDTSAASTTEAVEQVEQAAGTSVREVGQQVKQGVSRAVTKAKQERQKVKERQDQPKESEQSPEVPAPETPEAVAPKQREMPSLETVRAVPPSSTQHPPTSASKRPSASASGPMDPKTKPIETFDTTIVPKTKPADLKTPKIKSIDTSINPAEGKKYPARPPAGAVRSKESFIGAPSGPTAPKVRPTEIRANPSVPKTRTADTAAVPPRLLTPEDRMRQLAVDKRKGLARQPEPAPVLPEGVERLTPAHYGKPAGNPGTSVTSAKSSFENQSANQSIKERPRFTTILKEKRQGWTMAPRTRQSVEQATGGTTISVKAPASVRKETFAQRIRDRAHRRAQKEAQRGMAQGAKKTAKAAADFSKKTAAVSARAAKALVSALSALIGGGTLVAALCVIFLIAAVIASPFGLLFSNEPSPGAVPLNAAVTQINVELADKLALLQTGDYDSVDIQGSGPDWREVAAVFACKTSLGVDGLDVAALTPDRVARLKTVFWDMCEITTSVETIDHPASGSTEAWTEKILHITITAKTADDMRTVYSFTPEQNTALTELLAELNGIGTLLGDLGASQEDAAELLRRLPEDLSPERRAVIETACKLVGKVNYFWGGKSLVLGWDSRWGTIQRVWAAGSPSTGTYRPYGMDCSGFVDWVFYNMSDGSYVIGHGGGARMQHSYCTPISWSQAQPGDLVFYPEDTHVGIVGGWDASGNIQIIHCASGQNNVVITGKAGFTTIGRPNYYG